MNNDAPVAALGMDAVAGVNGYRHAVRDEATRRDLCLISEPLSDVVAVPPDCDFSTIEAFLPTPPRTGRS